MEARLWGVLMFGDWEDSASDLHVEPAAAENDSLCLGSVRVLLPGDVPCSLAFDCA